MNQVCNGCISNCEITSMGQEERRYRHGDHPAIHTGVCGNQYFHHMTFYHAGDFIPTHRHTYDHVFQVISGGIEIISETEGKHKMKAGDLFDVKAGIAHGMTALEDNTKAQCIHIMRWEDGTVVPFDYKLTGREMMQITGAM